MFGCVWNLNALLAPDSTCTASVQHVAESIATTLKGDLQLAG